MVSPRGSCAWYEARRGSAWLESVTALSKQNRYILRQNKRRFRACASSRYQALISCPLAPGYEAICYCNSYLHEIWSGLHHPSMPTKGIVIDSATNVITMLLCSQVDIVQLKV